MAEAVLDPRRTSSLVCGLAVVEVSPVAAALPGGVVAGRGDHGSAHGAGCERWRRGAGPVVADLPGCAGAAVEAGSAVDGAGQAWVAVAAGAVAAVVATFFAVTGRRARYAEAVLAADLAGVAGAASPAAAVIAAVFFRAVGLAAERELRARVADVAAAVAVLVTVLVTPAALGRLTTAASPAGVLRDRAGAINAELSRPGAIRVRDAVSASP